MAVILSRPHCVNGHVDRMFAYGVNLKYQLQTIDIF